MTGTKSRLTTALACAAAFSMTASPALAQGWGGGWGGGGWGHHRDRVDAGDVIAGILIIGGIAAIASAASSHKRDRRNEDRRPDYPRDRANGYGNDNDQQWAQNGSVDSAVARCTSEVSHGSNRSVSVDSINRDGDGWRVQGRTREGAEFSCTVDGNGRVRNAQVDGRAY